MLKWEWKLLVQRFLETPKAMERVARGITSELLDPTMPIHLSYGYMEYIMRVWVNVN
jgi:hypothetical protein